MLIFVLFFGDLEAESGINTAQTREESLGGVFLGDELKEAQGGGKQGKACEARSGMKPPIMYVFRKHIPVCRFRF